MLRSVSRLTRFRCQARIAPCGFKRCSQRRPLSFAANVKAADFALGPKQATGRFIAWNKSLRTAPSIDVSAIKSTSASFLPFFAFDVEVGGVVAEIQATSTHTTMQWNAQSRSYQPVVQTRTHDLGTVQLSDHLYSFRNDPECLVYASYKHPRSLVQEGVVPKYSRGLPLQPWSADLLRARSGDGWATLEHDIEIDPFTMKKETGWAMLDDRVRAKEMERAKAWARARYPQFETFRARVTFGYRRHRLTLCYLPAFELQYKYWTEHQAFVSGVDGSVGAERQYSIGARASAIVWL